MISQNTTPQEESYHHAKKKIKLALDRIREEENEAYDHAVAARRRQEAATDQEHSLENQVHQAHEDAEQAFKEIQSFDHKYLSNLDEWEMHRQVTNYDIAHRVEDYAKARLAEVLVAEEAAKLQENLADAELLDLMTKEGQLEAMLKDLEHTAQEAGVADTQTTETK